jgi:hypothetical protein
MGQTKPRRRPLRPLYGTPAADQLDLLDLREQGPATHPHTDELPAEQIAREGWHLTPSLEIAYPFELQKSDGWVLGTKQGRIFDALMAKPSGLRWANGRPGAPWPVVLSADDAQRVAAELGLRPYRAATVERYLPVPPLLRT